MLRKQPFGNSVGIKGNLYNETNSGITERGSVVMVLSKNGNDRNTVWSYQFSYVLAGNQPPSKPQNPEARNGKYTLTDTEVQPSTQYQYVLKSVGTDGTSTDYTEPLAVTTLATGDKPNITKQPESTSVRPGTDAVFTISATPTGGAKSVIYRWQSRTDGGHWTGLNKTDYQLTIENTYTSLPLVTGLYQNTDGKLFKPGAAETVEVTTTGSRRSLRNRGKRLHLRRHDLSEFAGCKSQ